MIVRVSGRLVEAGSGFVVVMTGGVGYLLHISEQHLKSLPAMGSPVDLYARQVVRENEISLYGFAGPGERRLFDLLNTVSGLGPRLSLGLIGALGEKAATEAIAGNNSSALAHSPGVGPKLAQRICMELGEKVREEALLGKIARGAPAVSYDVVEALISLGHRRAEAERAAMAAREEAGDADLQILIPLALKYAGKR